MSVITNIEGWGNSHRPGWLDIFRILLGLFITYKGFEFAGDQTWLTATVASATESFAAASIAHYVIFAHLLGGPMIVVGIFTRAVCAIQLPILIGAIILVNSQKGFLSVGNHMDSKCLLQSLQQPLSL
ncbi:MAG: DoxX family protein [Bacteroidota bacterium]